MYLILFDFSITIKYNYSLEDAEERSDASVYNGLYRNLL
jgi:hypothetical protein